MRGRSLVLVVVLVRGLVLVSTSCGRVAFEPLATDGGDGDGDGGPVTFDPSRCPPSYTEVFPGQSSRYRIEMATPRAWAEATADCVDDQVAPGAHTHLVVIASETERSALGAWAFIGPWLGVTDNVTEGLFLPSTTESIGSYLQTAFVAPWASSEPNNQGGENCVNLDGTGLLFDDDCPAVRNYVCECDGYPDAPSNY